MFSQSDPCFDILCKRIKVVFPPISPGFYYPSFHTDLVTHAQKSHQCIGRRQRERLFLFMQNFWRCNTGDPAFHNAPFHNSFPWIQLSSTALCSKALTDGCDLEVQIAPDLSNFSLKISKMYPPY